MRKKSKNIISGCWKVTNKQERKMKKKKEKDEKKMKENREQKISKISSGIKIMKIGITFSKNCKKIVMVDRINRNALIP
jgi:hypothetical protein